MMKILFSIIIAYLSFFSFAEDAQATLHVEKIVLGSGCFWGAEKGYEALDGVIDAVSGYADGEGVRPTYREITKFSNKFNPKNHAEVVEVTFNKNLISLEELIIHYLESHDPTQLNRQGNDLGTQYRSIVLYSDISQEKRILELISEYQDLLNKNGYGDIETSVKPLAKFFVAENYHQDYIKKNPNGYCPDHSTGVRFARSNSEQNKNNDLLRIGKNIVVIEPEGFCPYCERFRKDVSNEYAGSIPLIYRHGSNLDGLEIKTPTWATPTILFLEQGSEVFGYQGYMSPKDFYKALGFFKLGDTEAYQVAFNEGTDARYCKEYEIFKNTPDGVFIDKLSGAALFDTKYRFNSSTGWLSFTKPVKDSVYRRADNSYGMRRIEIRSVSSDIHLGHVFNDGPNGLPRYCINATVLEFKTRNEFNKIKIKEKV
jgi:peptide methionine sulfoxide reductase msrA/msrB|tara:strand:- start:107 stop:1390 length:1284 start_codon:yes stop_codon:yes gene_type:complete